MTEQEFRNKYVGKAVHCDTEEKAKELLKLAHDFGWTWTNWDSLTKNAYWFLRQEDTCYVFDLDKTTIIVSLGFYKKIGHEIVEFESEEKKVKKTKKVFDLGLFMDYMQKPKRSNEEIMGDIQQWALECHGLTEEGMAKKGWNTHDIWMKEVEVKVSLTEHEIEILKALKVLGLNWIARDGNNTLYAYASKPVKRGFLFSAMGNRSLLDKDLFKFITWQDEEATEIEELLCGLK